jgi:hypothetical protein
MDWQTLKVSAWKWTQRIAVFVLLQLSLGYLWGSVVAGRPIGPVEYVRFGYYTTIWTPIWNRHTAAVKAPVGQAAPSASAPKFKSMSKTTTAEEVRLMGTDRVTVRAVLPEGTPVKVISPALELDWLAVATEIDIPNCRTPAKSGPCWGYVHASQLVPLPLESRPS